MMRNRGDFSMIGLLRAALERRGEIRRLADVMAWNHGSTAETLAMRRAEDPQTTEQERAFFHAVAQRARRRHRYLESLDTATRYLEAPPRSSGRS
jgi:hypothetical protein